VGSPQLQRACEILEKLASKTNNITFLEMGGLGTMKVKKSLNIGPGKMNKNKIQDFIFLLNHGEIEQIFFDPRSLFEVNDLINIALQIPTLRRLNASYCGWLTSLHAAELKAVLGDKVELPKRSFE